MNLSRLDFEFDLNGYAIIPSGISRSQVDLLNRLVETNGMLSQSPKFMFIESDEAFYDLIFTPDVLELCSRWIGPHFRFDHAWGVHVPPNRKSGREDLHAGPYQNQGFFQYGWYNNLPRASCIVFCYVLEDQPEDEGGLVLLSGSHKLNYPIKKHASVDILEKLYGCNLSKVPGLVQPILNKGDILIMAEATVHGTSRWMSTTAWRRNLYFKYCHGFMGWLPHNNDVANRLRQRVRNDSERRVLEAPYVSKKSGNQQSWRPRTL